MTTHPQDITRDAPVAIIGIGCLFPRADGVKGYWRLLLRGEDGIGEVPASHWSPEDFFDADPRRPDHVYCKQGGFLRPVSFDPSEFGIPPASLEATDTSQLLALVAAKAALEDAGYGGDKPFDRSRTGVILGVTGTQELVIPLGARLGHPIWRRALEESGVAPEQADEVVRRISDAYVPWQENSFPGLLGNVVAGRICNRLDLGGTNCVVDAACASSMGAVHTAVMELSAQRSDMVITGGVDTINDIFMHMCFAKTHILSPSGNARPFSESADGTVLGEGVGLMVLKRLADAERDGDNIYAVIRGVGASSDGRSQSIYAPRPEGQAKALRQAYGRAGVSPSTVGMIEAHGTGTRVGDEVEFRALMQVFDDPGLGTPAGRQTCALGSVKSMIGHTKAAAGAAGLIKAALALRHKVVPPTLKAERPDPKLAMADSPFYLNTRSRPWLPSDGHPRRCGVSAFGFGGSNFHVLLEEHRPEKSAPAWDGSIEIAAFSAADADGLVQALADFCRRCADASAAGLAVMAADARKGFSNSAAQRLLVAFEMSADTCGIDDTPLPALLSAAESEGADAFRAAHASNATVFYGTGGHGAQTAFLFPGQGSQYPDMGRDLACCFPESLDALTLFDRAFTGSGNDAGRLSDIIYPPETGGAGEGARRQALMKTDAAQPAIGAVCMGMASVLKRFGVRPDASCGHSFGELTALWAAGWIDDEALAALAVARGRLMASAGNGNRTDAGAMLAVQAPLAEIEQLAGTLSPDLVLSNRNSPRQGVLAGPLALVLEAENACRRRGLRATRLPVAAAFHSPLMAAARRPLLDALRTVAVTPTDITVFSNTGGRVYPRDPEKVRTILAEHLLHPVDFEAQVNHLYDAGIRVFLEVGPRSVLSGLTRDILAGREATVISLDGGGGKRHGLADLAAALCRLAAAGVEVALDRWENPPAPGKPQRMRVPVCGANLRRSALTETPRAGRAAPAGSDSHDDSTTTSPDSRSGGSARVFSAEAADERPKPSVQEIMKPDNSPDSQLPTELVSDALQTVAEGLKTIAAMQLQTAETHRRFLDSQAEASRAIQEMIRQTHRMAEGALGFAPEAAPQGSAGTYPLAGGSVPAAAPDERQGDPVPAAAPAAGQMDSAPAAERFALPSLHPPPDEPVHSPPARVPAAQTRRHLPPGRMPEDAAVPPAVDPSVAETLLAVVSELTGYPVETLGLDMDIEADLGIDSIKRVEILSAMEERMPALNAVAPEDLGDLKTLGQIAVHLSRSPLPVTAADAPGETPAGAGPATNPGRCAAVADALLAVVSELTGYPVETLGLDMDIEADLGIDSIKRVEILSAMEERMPALNTVAPEDLGELKTLGQIVAHLSRGVAPPPEDEQIINATITESDDINNKVSVDISAGAIAHAVERFTVAVDALPPITHHGGSLPKGRKVFITDDRSGLSEAIADALGDRGVNTVLVSTGILRHRDFLPAPGGLILVQPPGVDARRQDLLDAFRLARHVAPGLIASARSGGAVLASVTRMDGAFGFLHGAVKTPMQGGLAGLVKTAAAEWPEVRCRALDVAPEWKDLREAARAVVAEVLDGDADGPVEAGLTPNGRQGLRLHPSPYRPEARMRLELGPRDVVVVTGGARGVTADAVLALAGAFRPTLVLLGRAPHPLPEPEWLASLVDPTAVKKAIVAEEFGGAPPTPRDIEGAYSRHMANREITRNLERLRATGATVLYFPADVRDRERLRAVFDEVRAVHGPISGILHGAGVLEDRLIVDKTDEQFETVFDTKVRGLESLLAAAGDDPLRYLVLFSSVTARLGNKGQADYAMANEVLNKMAHREAAARADCRVVAINWGPWDGGMVTPGLRKVFARQGVDLISRDLGPLCMIYEMAAGEDRAVEVVVGGKLPQRDRIAPARPDEKPEQPPRLSFTRELDLERYPILAAHRLDGKPVVPFALMAEWFGHGALHENPGLQLCGLDQLRVLKGLRLEDGRPRVIRMLAGKARRKGKLYEVALELRDGASDGIDRLHSRATAVLGDELEPVPDPPASASLEFKGYFRTMDEVYEKILFHGEGLRGIRKVLHLADRVMVASVSPAPPPGAWMTEPLRSRWIADPLILDCAFQMASLWCYEETGNVSLPAYSASYRQFCGAFPPGETLVVMEVKELDPHKMRADFTFLDGGKRVLARLTGCESVMDASLIRAFKPQFAANA